MMTKLAGFLLALICTNAWSDTGTVVGITDGDTLTLLVDREKTGDRILERRAIHITDPAEFDTALAALAAKYGFWKELQGRHPDDRPNLHMVRMDPR